MTDLGAFEGRLRIALARHVADAPEGVDPLAFARAVAAAEPRRRGRAAAIAALLARSSDRSRAARLVWIVAVVGLLLAATTSAVFVGSELLRRTSGLTVDEPAVTLTFAHPGEVTAVAWSPDGTHVATGSSVIEGNRDADWTRDAVRVWDANTGDMLFVLEQVDEPVDRIAFSPDGTRLAVRAFGALFDAATGQELPGEFIEFLAFSPDGTRIAAGGAWGWAAVLDATTAESQLELPLSPSWVWDAAWSPDGARLATTWGTGIRIWDAMTGVHQLAIGSRSRVMDLTWSPADARIATASRDASVATIYDAATGDVVVTLTGHLGAIWAVAWSPDGTRLATASSDGTARIWRLD